MYTCACAYMHVCSLPSIIICTQIIHNDNIIVVRSNNKGGLILISFATSYVGNCVLHAYQYCLPN